jgi:hypothetical protein
MKGFVFAKHQWLRAKGQSQALTAGSFVVSDSGHALPLAHTSSPNRSPINLLLSRA